MNARLSSGIFRAGLRKHYRSEDGRYLFTFLFTEQNAHVQITCIDHPSFNGQDSHPGKSHLYASGRLCFVAGKEPKTQERAEQLAKQWAEYFLEYRRTGRAQR